MYTCISVVERSIAESNYVFFFISDAHMHPPPPTSTEAPEVESEGEGVYYKVVHLRNRY